MKHNRKKQFLGNIFIAVAILTLTFIYYPIALVYLFPQALSTNVNLKGYYIQIPKISAQAPIELNVNPWSREEYLEKLKIGVAHAMGTAIPGQKGTSFIFAHSSGPPWEISRFNTVFLRLGELDKGDNVIIFKNGQKIIYKVTDKKEVWPSDVSFLKDLSKDRIILQTCTPIGTDFRRLLIFATPVVPI